MPSQFYSLDRQHFILQQRMVTLRLSNYCWELELLMHLIRYSRTVTSIDIPHVCCDVW